MDALQVVLIVILVRSLFVSENSIVYAVEKRSLNATKTNCVPLAEQHEKSQLKGSGLHLIKIRSDFMRRIKILQTIRYIAIALLTGALAAPILAALAYRERGYVAFGGEWLATIMIMVVAYLLIRKKVKPKEDKENSED